METSARAFFDTIPQPSSCSVYLRKPPSTVFLELSVFFNLKFIFLWHITECSRKPLEKGLPISLSLNKNQPAQSCECCPFNHHLQIPDCGSSGPAVVPRVLESILSTMAGLRPLMQQQLITPCVGREGP